jgi:hypothetical protein
MMIKEENKEGMRGRVVEVQRHVYMCIDIYADIVLRAPSFSLLIASGSVAFFISKYVPGVAL